MSGSQERFIRNCLSTIRILNQYFKYSNESKHFKDIVLTLKVHLTDEVFHDVNEEQNLVYFDEKGNKLTGVLNLGSMHYGQGTLYYTVNNGIYAGIFTAKCEKK